MALGPPALKALPGLGSPSVGTVSVTTGTAAGNGSSPGASRAASPPGVMDTPPSSQHRRQASSSTHNHHNNNTTASASRKKRKKRRRKTRGVTATTKALQLLAASSSAAALAAAAEEEVCPSSDEDDEEAIMESLDPATPLLETLVAKLVPTKLVDGFVVANVAEAVARLGADEVTARIRAFSELLPASCALLLHNPGPLSTALTAAVPVHGYLAAHNVTLDAEGGYRPLFGAAWNELKRLAAEREAIAARRPDFLLLALECAPSFEAVRPELYRRFVALGKTYGFIPSFSFDPSFRDVLLLDTPIDGTGAMGMFDSPPVVSFLSVMKRLPALPTSGLSSKRPSADLASLDPASPLSSLSQWLKDKIASNPDGPHPSPFQIFDLAKQVFAVSLGDEVGGEQEELIYRRTMSHLFAVMAAVEVERAGAMTSALASSTSLAEVAAVASQSASPFSLLFPGLPPEPDPRPRSAPVAPMSVGLFKSSAASRCLGGAKRSVARQAFLDSPPSDLDFATVLMLQGDLRRLNMLGNTSQPVMQEVNMGSSTKNESKMMPNVAFVRIVAQLDEILSGAPRHAHYFSILDPQLTVSLKKLKAELARPVGEYMAVHLWESDKTGLEFPTAGTGALARYHAAGEEENGVFHVYIDREHRNPCEALIHLWLQHNDGVAPSSPTDQVAIALEGLARTPGFGSEMNAGESFQVLSDRVVATVKSWPYDILLAQFRGASERAAAGGGGGGYGNDPVKHIVAHFNLELAVACRYRLLEEVDLAQGRRTFAMAAAQHGPDLAAQPASPLLALFRDEFGSLVRAACWRDPHKRVVQDVMRVLEEASAALGGCPFSARAAEAVFLRYTRLAAVDELRVAVRDGNPYMIREPDLCTVYTEMLGKTDEIVDAVFGLSKHDLGRNILYRQIRAEQVTEDPAASEVNPSMAAAPSPSDPDLSSALSWRYVAMFADGLVFSLPFTINLIMVLTLGMGLYTSTKMEPETRVAAGIGIVLAMIISGGVANGLARVASGFMFQWSFPLVVAWCLRCILAGIFTAVALASALFVVATPIMGLKGGWVMVCYCAGFCMLQLGTAALYNSRMGPVLSSPEGRVLLSNVFFEVALVLLLQFVAGVRSLYVHLSGLLFSCLYMFFALVFLMPPQDPLHQAARPDPGGQGPGALLQARRRAQDPAPDRQGPRGQAPGLAPHGLPPLARPTRASRGTRSSTASPRPASTPSPAPGTGSRRPAATSASTSPRSPAASRPTAPRTASSSGTSSSTSARSPSLPARSGTSSSRTPRTSPPSSTRPTISSAWASSGTTSAPASSRATSTTSSSSWTASSASSRARALSSSSPTPPTRPPSSGPSSTSSSPTAPSRPWPRGSSTLTAGASGPASGSPGPGPLPPSPTSRAPSAPGCTARSSRSASSSPSLSGSSSRAPFAGTPTPRAGSSASRTATASLSTSSAASPTRGSSSATSTRAS
jgi:hypothetical protein